MKKFCEHCGVEFEGSAQARFHSDGCRKAFARSKLVDPDLPVREIDAVEPEPAAPGSRSIDEIEALPADAPLTEIEEQLLRDHLGYAPSERRTRAERAGVAAKIRQRTDYLERDPNVQWALRTIAEQNRRSAEKKAAYLRSISKE